MWIIKRIDEADYGCEERLPGEPLMVLVTLENDLGQIMQFEIAEEWLLLQGVDEGDEWPEDIDEEDQEAIKANEQFEWMENYSKALQELEEGLEIEK